MITIISIIAIAIILWLIIGTIRVSGKNTDGFWDGFMTFMMLDVLLELLVMVIEGMCD